MISITEKLVLDPIQNLSQPQNSCIESELVTRIIGVATSIFALIDATASALGAAIILVVIVVKSALCCCDPNDYQVLSDLIGNVFKFTMITLVGSLMGVLFPSCLISCCTTQGVVVAGGSTSGNIGRVFGADGSSLADPLVIDEEKETEAILHLAALQQAVQEGDEVYPYTQLRTFFQNASLGMQARFVSDFSEPGIPQYEMVRETLADLVFQPKSLRSPAVQWLSREELHTQAEGLSSTKTLKAELASKGIKWSDNFHKGYFFHGTRTPNLLESILRSGKIEVRHQGLYRGAFVSTIPEHTYGQYFFVFKETIAHNSSLTIASNTSGTSYWAGLSQDIPIDKSTIAYIMINSDHEFDSLRDKCKTWAGWDVPVVAYRDIEDHLEALKGLNRGLPSGWPKPTS